MRLRRSEDAQFLEAFQVAVAREELRKAMDRLDEVLDHMERRLVEDSDARDE
jgi:hypothetical protein